MTLLWYSPIGLTYGNETLAAERLALIQGKTVDLWIPAAWIGLVLELLAIFSFFLFKKQRKLFPNFILGLIAIIDVIRFVRELVRFSPIPWVNEKYFWSLTQDTCAFIFLWVPWVEAALFVLSISLALIVYNSFVQTKKVDCGFDYYKKYFKAVVVLIITYPVIYVSVLGSLSGGYKFVFPSCGPISTTPLIIGLIQAIVSAVVIVAVLVHIFTAGLLSSHHKKAWRIIRYVLIIFLNALAGVLYNYYYIQLSPGDWPLVYIVVPASYYGVAVLVIWNNIALRKWVAGKYKNVSYQEMSHLKAASEHEDV